VVLGVAADNVRDGAERVELRGRRPVGRRRREDPDAPALEHDRGGAVAHRDPAPGERARSGQSAGAQRSRRGAYAEMVHTPGATSRMFASVCGKRSSRLVLMVLWCCAMLLWCKDWWTSSSVL
jgi:hypothetical protein